jgi:hypothetical protein
MGNMEDAYAAGREDRAYWERVADERYADMEDRIGEGPYFRVQIPQGWPISESSVTATGYASEVETEYPFNLTDLESVGDELFATFGQPVQLWEQASNFAAGAAPDLTVDHKGRTVWHNKLRPQK